MTSSDKAADAIKSITPEQLEKTRAEVHAEVENSKVVEAVDAEAEDETEDEDEEDETEDSTDDETEESVDPLTAAECERLAKIDMISDIQLILIDKYRGGLKLLMVCMLLSLAVLGAQVLQFFRTMSLHGSVIVLQEDQRKVLAKQEDMAKESKKDVEEVRIAVRRTEDKVEEAVESSPKIEIDDKGKVTKVIVPVRKAGKKDRKDEPELPPPPAPKPVQQQPPPPPAPVEFSTH